MTPIGSVGRSSSTRSLPNEATIDGFERGDLTPYTHATGANDWQAVTTAPVIEGSYSAQSLSGTDWNLLISEPGDGLPYYARGGDIIAGYLNETGDRTQVQYGWYATAAGGGDCYGVMIDAGNNTLELRRWDAGGSNLLQSAAVTIALDTWYDVETELRAGGEFVSRVYDVDQTTGDRTAPDTPLASVTATDTTHTGRGVMIGNRSSVGSTCAVDHLRKVGEV